MELGYRKAFAITPHDTNANVTKAIYVGGTGDVTVIMKDGTDPVTFKAVPVGTKLEVQARIVKATGTTATFLIGLL